MARNEFKRIVRQCDEKRIQEEKRICFAEDLKQDSKHALKSANSCLGFFFFSPRRRTDYEWHILGMLHMHIRRYKWRTHVGKLRRTPPIDDAN